MKWNNSEIVIHRSARRKTMHIIIERDGSISVQVPNEFEEESIREVLNAKEYEISKKIIRWKDANQEYIERQFLPGQSFLYLGRNYNLHIVENQKRKLLLKDGKFLLSSLVKFPREEFVKFYKRQAKIKIAERIDFYASRLAFLPQKVSVRDLPTRWGSCTPGGNVYFNWKCVMAPLSVLDYLIVHELVHLEYFNHSREFWDKVSAILPNCEESKDWLKRNGIRLTI